MNPNPVPTGGNPYMVECSGCLGEPRHDLGRRSEDLGSRGVAGGAQPCCAAPSCQPPQNRGISAPWDNLAIFERCRRMARYRVAVDTGGTFSDFVYLNETTGAVTI